MRNPDPPRGSYATVLSILFAAGLIYTMLVTLLLPAVRTLAHGLHSSEIDVTWVLTAYVLSGAVATPIAGRLGDMYGKQRTLVFLLTIVAAAERGFVIAFWLCAVGSLGASVIALFVPGRRTKAPPGSVQTAVPPRSPTIAVP